MKRRVEWTALPGIIIFSVLEHFVWLPIVFVGVLRAAFAVVGIEVDPTQAILLWFVATLGSVIGFLLVYEEHVIAHNNGRGFTFPVNLIPLPLTPWPRTD